MEPRFYCKTSPKRYGKVKIPQITPQRKCCPTNPPIASRNTKVQIKDRPLQACFPRGFFEGDHGGRGRLLLVSIVLSFSIGFALLDPTQGEAPDDLSTRGAAVRDDLRRSSKTMGTARR